MRVVMATFGTAGDVAPFAELGRALADRGHEVEIVTDVAHGALVEAAGLRARTPIRRYDPAALTGDPRYAQPGAGPYRLWRELFVPLVPEMFEAVGEALRPGAAVVVVHPWCHGALYAAQAAGVPVAAVAMAPITWWSWEDPGLYTPHVPPRWLHRALLRWPVRWGLDRLFGAGLHRARAALRLPPLPHPFFALGREAVVSFGLWPALLRGPAADDPRGATICGFPRGPPAAAALPPELREFLAGGAPPVVVGTGSLLPPMAGDLYRAGRGAALALGRRVVLVGARPELGGPGALVVPYASFGELFPGASAIVHHGGMGTLAAALRSGRPQVVVPFGNDQFDNGSRAERLGVARWLPRPRLAEDRLRAALAWALGAEASARARQVAEALAAEPDAAEVVAADLERRFGPPAGPAVPRAAGPLLSAAPRPPRPG